MKCRFFKNCALPIYNINLKLKNLKFLWHIFCKKLQADCRRGWMLALTAMLIVFAPAAFAQSAPTVTGTVTDQSGQPVIGATIIEQGTTNGATTGVDGSYSLKLRGGEFC